MGAGIGGVVDLRRLLFKVTKPSQVEIDGSPLRLNKGRIPRKNNRPHGLTNFDTYATPELRPNVMPAASSTRKGLRRSLADAVSMV